MLKENKKNKKILNLIVIGILGIALCYFLKYFFIITDIGIPCIFYETTNIYCPGCGMTRSFIALLNLDFLTAVRNNYLIIVLIPLAVYLLICRIKCYLLEKEFDLRKYFPLYISVPVLIIVILFTILRNMESFSWLRPLN